MEENKQRIEGVLVPVKTDLRRRHSWLAAVVLIALVLVIYWPVQHYGFINFDDQVYVADNFRIQHGITSKSLKDAFTSLNTGLWHPLTVLSFLFEYPLFGLNAGGYHWSNVIFHLLNSVMLFVLLRSMTGAVWRSAFVAVLFAVHPMNVESVAWIAERKNVLSTFFWILTMLLYVAYVRNPGWKRYVWVCVSFVLGLLSKPMLVTLPFVLLLMDYWPLNRTFFNPAMEAQSPFAGWAGKRKTSFLIAEKIPLFALTIVSVAITLYCARRINSLVGLEEVSLSDRLGNAFYAYVSYMKKLFWPQDLAVFYPFVHQQTVQIVSAIAGILILTLFVCRYVRKIPYGAVGWFWYLGTLVPVIGIVQNGPYAMADRFVYVPFIGLFLAMAWAGHDMGTKNPFLKKYLAVAAVLVIAVFSVAARAQVKIWADTTTLFEDAVRKNPSNYMAYQVLALEFARQGKHDRALAYNDIAIRLDPRSSMAYNNKGLVLLAMGKKEEALKNFEKAIAVNKFFADAYHNLGQFYLDEKDWDKTIAYSFKAVAANPEYVKSYNNLGVAFLKKGEIAESIKYLKKALQIDPYYFPAQKNLQIALSEFNNEIH
ncbi:MAG TPA: tetratricopeptide repeat protein [Smithella sp.]|nr:tetratricopeptide repeat protein [Smithella sp.]